MTNNLSISLDDVLNRKTLDVFFWLNWRNELNWIHEEDNYEREMIEKSKNAR